ncbi:MAG: AI-2E family transporter [Jatrophihabitantaceae bacterium]
MSDHEQEDTVQARTGSDVGDDLVQAADAAGVEVTDVEAVVESLFDTAATDETVDAANPFGVPGRPVSRSSAFYRGFVGALGVLAALALGMALKEIGSVITLVVVSAFLAVGLNPIVELMIRHGVRRRWAVAIVAVSGLVAFALILVVLVGAVRDQVSNFVDDVPHLIDDLRGHKSIRHLDEKYHLLTNLQAKLESPNLVDKLFGGVFEFGVSGLGALLNAVIIYVMTVYFLAALPQLKRSMYSLVPASRRERVGRLGDEILHRVGGYVIGAALVALLAGTLSYILLWCVGLGHYALPLALFVAVLDLVPLVGSVTGAGVVCLVALATSLNAGIACVLFYLIYEPLEGYVIYPRVMRSSVDVPEIVTIIAVLVGGALAGIVGALLALPIAAAVLLLVREVWVRRQDAA